MTGITYGLNRVITLGFCLSIIIYTTLLKLTIRNLIFMSKSKS